MNYVIVVQSFTHIKTASLAWLVTALSIAMSAPSAKAAELTPREHSVCPSLRTCVDILRRHDATEFDYDVLEAQFRRFGPTGRVALFRILETEAGNPDIARMISRLGPVTANERAQITKNWSLQTAGSYLPLLLDGHPTSRDFLLLSLGSEQVIVRENARRGLIRLSETAKKQAVPDSLRDPLLSALEHDPIAAAAPYLAQLNAAGEEEKFAGLLRSGEPSIVTGAYSALYRHSPPQAFKLLLREMDRVTSSKQSQAIGDMLLRRHAGRSDGFYLKFANDISGDKTRSISARASGLHAVLAADGTKFPEFTSERAEALEFLVRGQPFVTQEKYLPVLKKVKAEREMAFIWAIAQDEKWINRDQISTLFKGEKIADKVIDDLLKSDDFRSFTAGVAQAQPSHENLIQAQSDHAIKDIAELAHKKLGLKPPKYPTNTCRISQFDSADVVIQMPFFTKGWTTLQNEARVSLERKNLTAAHPNKTGWLAGYDLEIETSKAERIGGALVFFDNRTGDFIRVGNFSGPVVILPDRTLKLGETTEKFWVIDSWGDRFSELSAYSLDLTNGALNIRHLGALPNTADSFSVAPNGDLLVAFKAATQAPIRLTSAGNISLACASPRRTPQVPAPN